MAAPARGEPPASNGGAVPQKHAGNVNTGTHSLYPNPSPGGYALRLALRGYRGQTTTVRVTDVLGRSVHTLYLQPEAYATDAPLTTPRALAPGVYVVDVRSATQHQTTRLLVTE